MVTLNALCCQGVNRVTCKCNNISSYLEWTPVRAGFEASYFRLLLV